MAGKPQPHVNRKRPVKVVDSAKLSRAASKYRDKFVAELGDQLRPGDMPALEVLCRSIVLLNRALAEAEKTPIVVKQSTGVTSMNQAIRAVCELRQVVAKGMAQFGLSPVDRADAAKAGVTVPRPAAKMQTPESEEEDFEDLLKARPATIPINKRSAG